MLFQVVLHAQIAREEGVFTLDDVVQEVSEKMIRRHPHVFAPEDPARSVPGMKSSGRKRKAAEDGKSAEEIPAAFPALIRAVKAQKKLEPETVTAAEAAGRVRRLLEAFDQDAVSPEDAEKRIGDLLYEICRLSGAAGVYPEKALADTVEEKIRRRISAKFLDKTASTVYKHSSNDKTEILTGGIS